MPILKKMTKKNQINKPKPKAKTNKNKTVKKQIHNDKKNQINDTNKPKEKISKNKCISIRNHDEPYSQCLLKAKLGEKYCPLHLIQENVKDFVMTGESIIEKIPNQMDNTNIINTIIPTIDVSNLKNKNIKTPKNKTFSKISKKTNNTIFKEQKVNTILNNHKNHEDDLEIKLLILVNDDEYFEKISELIGPVFNDITVSEDEQDPMTFDSFWEYKNNSKVPSSFNKYYLFSYSDSNNKIRCLTIFTLYNMINDNNFLHPLTMEIIPEKDIIRAKELINLYDTKLNLFDEDQDDITPEYKLKNRINNLFKQFHIHSIYFESNWLTSITDISKLYKIISETEKLVSNNLKIINPNLHGFKIFQRRKKGVALKKKNEDDSEEILELKEYIIGEWEQLIKATDNPQNQIPIWIIASGLSFVVPEIKTKFPDLEIMA